LPAALDFAVTSGLRESIVSDSAIDGTSATQAYEDYKRSYLDTERLCEAEGIQFIPVIVEAHGGGWGAQAHKLWNELAKRKAALTGELESTVACELLQSLSIVLHRENARAILRRWPQPAFDAPALSAAVVASS